MSTVWTCPVSCSLLDKLVSKCAAVASAALESAEIHEISTWQYMQLSPFQPKAEASA